MRVHRGFSQPGVVLLAVAGMALGLLDIREAHAQRRISEEAILFRQLKSGVCTVYGDNGQGTGFLVDSLGIVLTNDHVVGGSSRIRIKFDDSTRVEALLLSSDSKRDVAALAVAPSAIRGYSVLRMAVPSDTMVFEGEKVMALGSPLHQEKVMTVGIVSKVEPTAIISDVNINHGNSGGPLVNMNGDVVAINTFGDMSEQGGPGISGSIKITEASEVVGAARAALGRGREPSPRRLPIASHVPFPVDSLREAAGFEKFDKKPYEVSSAVGTGKFVVTIVTPIYDTWRTWRYEIEIAKRSKQRERKGGAAEGQTTDPLRQMRNWMRYTGSDYAPVVTIQMMPQIGQTAGSIFGNILGAAASGYAGTAYRGSYRYEYKADFLRAELTRDSVIVDDLSMFRAMIPRVFASADWNGSYSMGDQARAGIMQVDPSVFEPTAGRLPKLHMKVWSVEKPDAPYEFDLPATTVQRVWSDFAAWRTAAGVAN